MGKLKDDIKYITNIDVDKLHGNCFTMVENENKDDAFSLNDLSFYKH